MLAHNAAAEAAAGQGRREVFPTLGAQPARLPHPQCRPDPCWHWFPCGHTPLVIPLGYMDDIRLASYIVEGDLPWRCNHVYIPHMADRRTLSCTGNWSVKWRQFSSPTWFLKPRRIFVNISFRSSLGCVQEATASQKNMKSCTTPAGFTCIIWQMPRKAESFSSLSRMFRNDVHLIPNF